jgi:divalent metal cation (Fe/Co/Zn/Cd) transporter
MTVPSVDHTGVDSDSSHRRAQLIRRSQRLSRVTLGYNIVEGVVSVGAGAMAGSVSLVGFGIDSIIESVSSVTALWRLRRDADARQREHAERRAHRVIGASFILLTVYIAVESVRDLWARAAPERTIAGLAIAALSVVVMPILAKRKRHVARQLGSRALESDAMQTNLCTYLSAIVLVGLVLNATLGWWWADGVAGLLMLPIIVREGIEGLRGRDACEC